MILGHRTRLAADNDPAGLRVAADLDPERVVDGLRDLLEVPTTAEVDLELPLGVRVDTPGEVGVGDDGLSAPLLFL